MRRIELVATGQMYPLRPEFAMPYMVGRTDEVEKGLYLRRYGVPFDALAYVFGRERIYIPTTVAAGLSPPLSYKLMRRHCKLCHTALKYYWR